MSKPEYFSVYHHLAINIEPLAADYVLPEAAQFDHEIPTPFMVANEFNQLDRTAERAKQELLQHDLNHVVTLLDTQNSKLNLLLNFMLQQQNDDDLQCVTQSFGASNFSFRYPTPLAIGTLLRTKLFLQHPAGAIYCYARVVNNPQDETEGYCITADFERIRETDQDLLIKAALIQQQKLLRQRSLQRESAL